MTALAASLQAFFTQRLIQQRRASPHTIAAYRDTLRMLLIFTSPGAGKRVSNLDIADLDASTIAAFLDHLQHERGNSIRTRNARLAAIHSLFGYLALAHPEHAWSASEFAIEIGVSIRQHPTGSPTSTGGSDHVRTRPWDRPWETPHQAVPVCLAEVRDLVAAGPSGGDDRRGRSRRTRRPVHDHADPHRREGGCAGGAGRVQTRRAGPGAGLRTRAGQGRGGPAVRDGQGDGRQADVGPGKSWVGLSGRVPAT